MKDIEEKLSDRLSNRADWGVTTGFELRVIDEVRALEDQLFAVKEELMCERDVSADYKRRVEMLRNGDDIATARIEELEWAYAQLKQLWGGAFAETGMGTNDAFVARLNELKKGTPNG